MKRPGMLFKSLKALKAEVAAERRLAVRAARYTGLPWIRSRGTFLTTITKHYEQCPPLPRAECPEWKGTLAEIHETLDRVLREYPEVDGLVICGGYDGARYLGGFEDGDYEPWIGEWDVVVWTRPKAQEVAA